MMDAIDYLKKDYEKKIKEQVMPAFRKYDADGSDSIDKEELQFLIMETLGMNLSGDQADAALVDLDLNKDGTIDFNEF